MLHTYKAILKGDHLEWRGDMPTQLSPAQAVAVHITILDESVTSSIADVQGQRMAAALEQLAASIVPSTIPDPLAWERAQREERPLSEREALLDPLAPQNT